ncbi:MAG: hypothetical protein K2N18_04740, partial [Clostridia bacterium]|nr:hypothetical protein [Clostridia bacterium]
TIGNNTNALTLVIDVKANVGLGALMLKGIAGALYSDIAVDISVGYPLNKKLLSLYYLGSSRLVKYGSIYELGSTGDIMSDAIYVDLSALGLGKIKLQGVAGLLGGTYSYDEAKTVAEGDNVNVATPIALDINLENDKVALSFDTGLFNAILSMLDITLDFELPNIQSAVLTMLFSDKGISSLTFEAGLDGEGTAVYLGVDPISLTFGANAFDSKNLTQEVKTDYAGLTLSNTMGMMGLIQNVLDNLVLNMSIEIQNNVLSVGYGNASGYGDTGYYEVLKKSSKITLNGQKKYDVTNSEKSNVKGYKLFLELLPSNYNDRYDRTVDTTRIVVGGNLIFLSNLPIELDGIASAAQGVVNSQIGFLQFGPLELLKPDGGDNKIYKYPTSSNTGGITAEAAPSTGGSTGGDTGTPSENEPFSYSYTPNLTGLIKSFELNVDNRHGYTPYYDGMGAMTRDKGLISFKIKFDKNAFNELLIMLDCAVLSFISDMNSHAKAYGGVQNYFINPTSQTPETGKVNTNGKDPSGNYLTYKTVRELLEAFDRDHVQKNTTTEAKVKFLEPYIRAIPYALLKYLLRDMLYDVLDGAAVVGCHSMWDQKSALGLYTVPGVAGPAITNLSRIVSGILPLPFSVGNIDPSLNIYIDLDPVPSQYGLTASGSNMTPGIRAIELMINCEKNGTGTNMSYLSTSSNAMGQYYITGRTTSLESAWDAFMLRITPYSVNKVENSQLLGFDDSTTASVTAIPNQATAPTSIEITDPAR